jgi:hypothetical protein
MMTAKLAGLDSIDKVWYRRKMNLPLWCAFDATARIAMTREVVFVIRRHYSGN